MAKAPKPKNCTKNERKNERMNEKKTIEMGMTSLIFEDQVFVTPVQVSKNEVCDSHQQQHRHHHWSGL